MLRKTVGIFISLALVTATAGAAETSPAPVSLSASAIVDRNVAARGGLQTWRAVKTMSFAGKLTAGGNQRNTIPVPVPDRGPRQKSGKVTLPVRPSEEVQLPFVMDLKRTRKMRMELQFNGQTAIQVFDGSNGWKLRPFLNRKEVEPYTAEEMKSSSTQADLDGYLIDYSAKGTKIELEGNEKVEGLDAYKLKLTTKDGQAIHVWINAQTFLEAKIEGQPRRLDGVYHPVEIYYRDYKSVRGLQIPHVLETRVLPASNASAAAAKAGPVQAEKIVIEKVEVNPELEESLFTKPQIGAAPKAK